MIIFYLGDINRVAEASKVSNVSADGAKGKKISQLIRKRRRPLAPRSRAQEFDSLMVLNAPCWHSGGMLQRLDPVAVWVSGLRCSTGRPRRTAVCKALLFLPNGTRRFFGKTRRWLQGCFCSYFCALAFLIVTYINMKRAPTFSVVLTQRHWEPFTGGRLHLRWSVFDSSLALFKPALQCLLRVCFFLFFIFRKKSLHFWHCFQDAPHRQISEEPISSPASITAFVVAP